MRGILLYFAFAAVVTMVGGFNPQKKTRVIFFGDSITQMGTHAGGYISLLQDSLNKSKRKGILTTDGIHLNEAGNRFVAARFFEALTLKK